MVCLLITTNTRQLGTATTTTTTTTAAAAVAHSVMAAGLLKKSDYLLPTSWFYETFMPVLSEVSLRIRCSSYCSDDGAMGTLIYIYIYLISLLLFTYPELLSPYVSAFVSLTETRSSFSTSNSAHSTCNISS